MDFDSELGGEMKSFDSRNKSVKNSFQQGS